MGKALFLPFPENFRPIQYAPGNFENDLGVKIPVVVIRTGARGNILKINFPTPNERNILNNFLWKAAMGGDTGKYMISVGDESFDVDVKAMAFREENDPTYGYFVVPDGHPKLMSIAMEKPDGSIILYDLNDRQLSVWPIN